MGKQYQNKVFLLLAELQKDLKDNKITQAQFNFLVGFLLKQEMNKFIDAEMDNLLPEKKADMQDMAIVSYKRSRKFTYAT